MHNILWLILSAIKYKLALSQFIEDKGTINYEYDSWLNIIKFTLQAKYIELIIYINYCVNHWKK